MADARKAALTALERCRRAGAWSDAVLGSVMDTAGLQGADRGLCTVLCYGVIQNRSLLDYVIGQHSRLPLRKTEPKVLDILRISAFQLLMLDKIPASAAVNEAVRLAKTQGYSRASGYVNAVLRKVAECRTIPEIPGEAVQRLSIRYSHPEWLTGELLSRLGEAETEALLRQNNAPCPVTIQTNSLKTTTQALKESLCSDGVETVSHPDIPDCLLSEAPGDLTRTEAYREGLFYVQDAAARFAVLASAPKAGERILDLCAAPGGKSFAAAVCAQGRAEIVACDIHENKLRRIRDGAERLGFDCIRTHCGDARANRPEWNGGFDLVIADVPCSGLGVIRKKPDIRWKDPAEFANLPGIQAAILENAARYVRPGGRLLYATCTVRSAENEDIVNAFYRTHADFAPLAFSSPWDGERAGGMLQLWPQRQGTDGFFTALMRRNGD